MKWHDFDSSRGSRQKRPPERKYVLVRLASTERGYPEALAVGYRKNAAGDKQCPFFVIPGIGGTVLAWCDCLPEGFVWPPKARTGHSTLEMVPSINAAKDTPRPPSKNRRSHEIL